VRIGNDVFVKEAHVSGGSGSADAANAQIQADEMRMNPGTMGRWGKGEKRRMLLALLPLMVFIVLAFLASR